VVEPYPSEKYIKFVSWDKMTFPTEWNKKHIFQTNNQIVLRENLNFGKPHDIPNRMESHKIHVPNYQPDIFFAMD
jgi:hypothetical protein